MSNAKELPHSLKAAYGGENWAPRTSSHLSEIGSLWEKCGIKSEWAPLKQVLLHPPGIELSQSENPESLLLLEIPDWQLARLQHQNLAQAYSMAGITVIYVEPDENPSPNLIFCADLFFMTPEGAILARPASMVRAGEERWIARRLADRGIPILRTLTGTANFEGADALWIDPTTVLIGRGLRTNAEGILQVASTLNEIGVDVIPVDLPVGTMHLMGIVRIIDQDLAMVWQPKLAWSALETLQSRGFQILFIPDETEAIQGGALNFVTLAPRHILMAKGNPITRSLLAAQGVRCQSIEISELLKAAGGIGCLTGIIERDI